MAYWWPRTYLASRENKSTADSVGYPLTAALTLQGNSGPSDQAAIPCHRPDQVFYSDFAEAVAYYHSQAILRLASTVTSPGVSVTVSVVLLRKATARFAACFVESRSTNYFTVVTRQASSNVWTPLPGFNWA